MMTLTWMDRIGHQLTEVFNFVCQILGKQCKRQ